MSDDSLARSPSDASATAEADYDAIFATIVATERGRWFLNEHVRRYRGADTALVLASLDRIEEAMRGTAGLAPAAQNEILALLETIWRARGEVIGRHGDPAASGEAAISDFRYAAEQIQGLVLAARAGDADPDPGGQLAFQLSRLSGAGDRLERSVAALRVMLGLFDEIEQRLHRLADAGPADEAAAPPEPSTDEIIPADDSASEAVVTDWGFDPGDTQPQPPPSVVTPAAERPAPGMSAFERLEAREYGRRHVMSAVAASEPAEPGEDEGLPTGSAGPTNGSSLDDMVIASAPAEPARTLSPLDSVPADWTAAPAEVMAPAAPIFDPGLFDADDQAAPPAASALESAMPEEVSSSPFAALWEQYTSVRLPEAMLGPAPLPSGEPPGAAPMPSPFQESPAPEPEPQSADVPRHALEQGIGADQPSVSDRLESMRTAIAALMDEVSEKTAGRIPPPRRS
jgi:hypothetical protein